MTTQVTMFMHTWFSQRNGGLTTTIGLAIGEWQVMTLNLASGLNKSDPKPVSTTVLVIRSENEGRSGEDWTLAVDTIGPFFTASAAFAVNGGVIWLNEFLNGVTAAEWENK